MQSLRLGSCCFIIVLDVLWLASNAIISFVITRDADVILCNNVIVSIQTHLRMRVLDVDVTI